MIPILGSDNFIFPIKNSNTKITLVYPQGDILKLPVQVVVNAANEELLHGGGVCGAIFRAAGAQQLQDYIFKNKLGPITEGQAVITPSFVLQNSYAKTITSIIHAVGPRYQDGKHGETDKLFNAYYNSLQLADDNSTASIAFPFISAGIFSYPLQKAAEIAVQAVRLYAQEHQNSCIKEIYFAFPTAEHGQLFKAILEKNNHTVVDKTIRNQQG